MRNTVARKRLRREEVDFDCLFGDSSQRAALGLWEVQRYQTNA
jgi:hypothetical protein